MNCEHKNIKFYPLKNRVICMDCGDDWQQHPEVTFAPYVQPIWVIPNYIPQVPFYQPLGWPVITCGSTVEVGSESSTNLYLTS
jgi:hypothetical protein